MIYPVHGLAVEAGEVANKIKKIIRDNDMVVTQEVLDAIEKALGVGDVWWYLLGTASRFGLSIRSIADKNAEKLQHRVANDTIKGSGDNR